MRSNNPKHSLLSSRRLLHAAVGLAILIVVVAGLSALAYLYRQAEERAVTTTQNLAVALEQSLEGMIDSIDVALQASADEIARRVSTGEGTSDALVQTLVRHSKRLPHQPIFRGANERGDVVFGEGVLTPPHSIADRDFFIRARDEPNAGLVVSKPIIARIDNVWIWLFARRINRPDGQFGGVVFARINIDSLEHALGQIHMGTDGLIGLRDADMGMIARYPHASQANIPVGDTRISPFFVRALQENPRVGSYVSGEGSVDGISRTQSYRRNAKYAFTVNVGISREMVLADWYRQLGITLGLMAAFITAALLFSRVIQRAWRSQEEHTAALLASRRALQEAQALARIGHYAYDLQTDRWSSSEVLDEIFGIDANYPRDQAHWLALVVADSRQAMQAYLASLIREGVAFDHEYQITRHCNGEVRWVHGKGRLEVDADGQPLVLLGAIQDITERKQSELQRQENESRVRAVFDSVSDAIFIHDAETGLILDVNKRMCEMYGYSRNQVIGLNVGVFSQGEVPYSVAEATEYLRRTLNDDPQTFEWVARARDGHCFWVEVSLRLAQIGSQRQVLAVVRDISSRKAADDVIKELAFCDPLTKLPNRRLMTDRMQQLLSRNIRHAELAAVCMLDLDGFKAVNDRFGHESGDVLLCEVAHRLLDNVRQADTVARFGGDEFALLLGLFNEQADLEELLARIVVALARPMSIKGATVQISASIGVAVFPTDSLDPDMLLRFADKALYEAKRRGKNCFQFYQAESGSRQQLHLEMLGRIGKALLKGQFELFYQPQIDCLRGTLVGVEALVRWRHPLLGVLPPAEFLPLIQHNDHIVNLDEWVLKEALRQMVSWREAGVDLRFSVNISARQLRRKDFSERLSATLQLYPADCADYLTIEVSEAAALENITAINAAFSDSHARVASVAIDDFGTGFSSLAHLTQLAVDILKIDKSIIEAMFDGVQSIALVESVIALGYSFQRQVTAEGVETIDQAMMLCELGCHVMQGYFFAPPMPADDFLSWAKLFKPDPRWHAASAVGPGQDYHDLMQALVSHHHWLSRVLSNTAARSIGEESDALLREDQCQFGKWYAAQAQVCFAEHPVLASLGRVHTHLHHLASALYASRRRGEQGGARPIELELLSQHEALLRLLSALRATVE